MPRPNAARTMFNEDNLSRRVAHEREQRGWTYEGLAKRMSDVGCAIHSSALYKIEKGQPRRRITVDELVALADVFSLPVEEMLIPYEVILDRVALEHIKALRTINNEIFEAVKRGLKITEDTIEMLKGSLFIFERFKQVAGADRADLHDVPWEETDDSWSHLMAGEVGNQVFLQALRRVDPEQADRFAEQSEAKCQALFEELERVEKKVYLQPLPLLDPKQQDHSSG